MSSKTSLSRYPAVMRLYLLPLSTRRTLLHAQRFNSPTEANSRNLIDRTVDKAATKWSEWEKLDSGWQRKVVDWGNRAFRRIPYEEWSLKSVPPLSGRKKTEELQGQEKVQLVFPRNVIPVEKAEGVLRTLAVEREALHRSRLIWCIVGMPIALPFGLLPVIPNIPFFYLLYRAWSHWRAIQGGRHIKWLITNRLVQEAPLEMLDEFYSQDGAPQKQETSDEEQLLITPEKSEKVADMLELPTLAIEMERAVWQVEEALKDKSPLVSNSTLKTKGEENKDQ